MSSKCCQSCGLPWNKDPEAGGSEKDGTKSAEYCSYCYKNGAFVQADWKVADMQAYALKVLSQKGIPELIGKLMTKEIPKLRRWQS